MAYSRPEKVRHACCKTAITLQGLLRTLEPQPHELFFNRLASFNISCDSNNIYATFRDNKMDHNGGVLLQHDVVALEEQRRHGQLLQ